MNAVWMPFRLDKREMEWMVTAPVVEHGREYRTLTIRSVDGKLLLQAEVYDDVFARVDGRIWASVINPPQVLGVEFPFGQPVSGERYRLDGGFELARYGIIHTELVRSLVGRWTSRWRYGRKRPK